MLRIKHLFYIFIFITFTDAFSQVGIGTTSPDDSSVLDVVATDKGLLIPRVSLPNITTTMLDGLNTAATGLLIFNTNATVTGGNGTGYYYFNGTVWEKLISGSTNVEKINDLLDGKSDNDGSQDGSSVFLGLNAGINDDSSDNKNVGVGFESLLTNSNGYNNTAIGYQSIYSNTTGSGNAANGYQSLSNNTIGNWNVANGNYALYSNIGGNNNTANGNESLYYNTNGYNNTANGYESMFSNTNGIDNTANGMQSLYSNTIGANNTASGLRAMYLNTEGNDNTAIGHRSLYSNTLGRFNTANGSHALYGNTIGEFNTANGYQSLVSNSQGLNNTATGSRSLFSNLTGSDNVADGFNALNRNVNGNHNNAMGSFSQFFNVSGSHNLSIGYQSLLANVSGSYNIGIGSNTGASNGTGSNNIYLGHSAGLPETGSHKLYIENSGADSNNALIYGEFDTNILRTNSQFQIGNPTGTGFAFPSVDGTVNQVMQTNGSGNVSWVDSSTLGSDDHDFYAVGTTNAPNSIFDNIFTRGNVSIGKNTSGYTLDIESTSIRGINTVMNSTNNGTLYGHFTDIINTGNGIHFGLLNLIRSPGDGSKYGIRNSIPNSGNGEHIGNENLLSGSGTGRQIGTKNEISNSGNNVHYGTVNELTGAGSGYKTGTRNLIVSDGIGIHFGTRNIVNGTGNGLKYGTMNEIANSGSFPHIGTSNNLTGAGIGPQYGNRSNILNTGNGDHYGTYNNMDSSGSGSHFGSYNELNSSGDGTQYGTRNFILSTGNGGHIGSSNYLTGSGTGFKYGTRNIISDTAGGTHFGVYSSALKSGSFAGYFLGNVAIGTTIANTYILPVSRGSTNQIMQTDASGNVSWVDSSTLGSDDHDFYEEGTSNSPNNINDDIYTLGNVAIGKTTADYALDIEEPTADRGINVRVNQNDSSNSGIYIVNSSTGNGLHHGVYNDMRSGNGLKFGVRNEMSSTSTQVQGVLNNMIGNGPGTYIGVNNFINGTGSGRKYGSYTRNSAIAQGDLYGVYSDVRRNTGIAFAGFFAGNVAIGTQANTSVTPNYYILPHSRGTANQIMQTDATGNVSWVDSLTVGSDNQNISGTGLSGTNLTIGIENGTSEIVDLSSLQDGIGTDDQTLSYNSTTGQLDIEDGNSVNLAIGDITAITAGDGLVGGGTNGALTLDVVATNGLTTNANNIVLGGTLTQATTILQGTNDLTYNLNSTGDFIVQEASVDVFEVRDNGNIYFGSDTFWKDVDTDGTNIGAFIDDGDDGRFLIYENGILSVDLDANTGFVFNDQGLDRDFRIESDTNSSIFKVDAGNSRIGIMKNTPLFDFHLKQSGSTASSAGGIALENSTTTANWKIYHSGGDLSFAESGTKRGHIASGSGMYVPVSDRRLKKNITEFESVLSKLKSLKLYSYLYKDQELSAKKTIGFMAQDIQPIFPELVSLGDDGYLGLIYSGFGVLAVKAIQEQQDIITKQQQQIDTLQKSQDNTETLISSLLKRIEVLENQD